MDKILVEVTASANSRKVLRQLPDARLLERLTRLQNDGTAAMLAAYLAECREELHSAVETPGAPLSTERTLGATALLADLIGLLSDPRTLLALTNRAATK